MIVDRSSWDRRSTLAIGSATAICPAHASPNDQNGQSHQMGGSDETPPQNTKDSKDTQMKPLKYSSLPICRHFIATLLTVATLPLADAQKPVSSTELRVEESKDSVGWNIYQGDELFAGYLADVSGTPIIYPINLPGEMGMTRNFPMKKDVAGEKPDHDHHRSLWLTHGDVNGIDFWIDDKGSGRIVQTGGKARADKTAGTVMISTSNDWLDPDGKKLLSDVRHFEFIADGERRIIDCDFLLRADEGDVNFGDTKEGSFGMRIASTMKVDAKLGGKITNDKGETNKNAWGKKSAWVNYSGPVNDKPVGITIHAHPSGFGYPCRWHVRTYGLFAANPFGVHHFEGGPKRNGIVLKEGSAMRLNYRVVLYPGEFSAEKTKADSKAYENEPRPELK